MKGFTVIKNARPPKRDSFHMNSIVYAFSEEKNPEKIYCHVGFYPYGDERYEVWMQHTEHFREAARTLIKTWKLWLKGMTVKGKRFCIVAQNQKLVRMLGFSESSPIMTILEEGDGE